MFEEIDHAVGVENVAAAKLRASLRAHLARVADTAQLFSILSALVVERGAGRVNTGQTSLLIGDTVALMATLLDL